MKLIKKLVLLILAFYFIFSSICSATNEPTTTSEFENDSTEDIVGSSVTNIINTDIYIGKQDIIIEDLINGNVFAFGSNVTIKSEVVGDLFVIADTLIIEENAVIYSNVFSLTNTFIMKGNAYDVYALSNSFELDSSGSISRDLKLYSQDVNLEGTISKDAYIFSNSISMPENAKNLIGGNLHYTSSQEFTFPEEAILGEILYTSYAENTATTEEVLSYYILNFVNTIIYTIVIIVFFSFFASKFVEKVSYALIEKSFVSAGIGILSIILIPVISILFLITGFLSYVSLAALIIYGLILSSALAIFSIAIGKYFVNKLKTPSRGKFILCAIVSAMVLWLLQIIPYIGGYISLFIFVVGLGVFIFALFIRKDVSELGKNKKNNKK